MVSQKYTESGVRSETLTIPELEQSKATVLNTLASVHSRRSYSFVWVAPSEGASLAAPRRTTAPLIDGSEDARSLYLSNRGRDAGENGRWRSGAAAVGVR